MSKNYIFCSKVVEAIKFEAKKIHDFDKGKETGHPMKIATLPNCDAQFELAKIKLQNCSRYNSDQMKLLSSFTSQLTNPRKNCSTIYESNYFKTESNIATHDKVLTNCDLALNKTLGNIVKCHNDSLNIAVQISEINQTLTAKRCSCGLTCSNGSKYQNQNNKASNQINTNVTFVSFSQAVQPKTIPPTNIGLMPSLLNNSNPNSKNPRSHITDAIRPNMNKPFVGPDLSPNLKLLTPAAVVQDPEFSNLQISRPMEQKQASLRKCSKTMAMSVYGIYTMPPV